MIKMVKNSYKIVALCSIFFLVGCGGGGSASSSLPSKPDSSQMAKIDNDNAKESSLFVYSSINALTDAELFNPNAISLNSDLDNNARKSGRSLKVYKESCDSGNIKIDTNEADKTATFTYNNCLIDGTTTNGKIKVYFYDADLYEADFENFTIINSQVKVDIKKANAFYIGDELQEMKKTYMSIAINDKKLEYFNFNFNTEDEGINFNGYVKPYCLDGFLYVKSNGTIKNKADDSYSNEKIDAIGSFIVKANKEVKVDLDGDLIFITLPNKQEEVYKNKDIINALKSNTCSVSIKQIIPDRPKRTDFAKLGSTNDKNTIKIASGVFNSTNIDINETLPYLETIFDDINNGLDCISGNVDAKEKESKIYATYSNCKVNNNTIYDGNISYNMSGDDVEEMVLSNLKITHNSKANIVKRATITKKEDEDGIYGAMFYFNNLYATIDENEYLNFNLRHQVGNSKNVYTKGYVKPKCLGKYLFIDSGSIEYNMDANLENFSLNLVDKPEIDLKDDDENFDMLSVDFGIDTDEDSVEISFLGDEPNSVPLNEFINKCRQ